MPLLYTGPRYLDHDTGAHPERAQRLVQVSAHLTRLGLDQQCQRPAWTPAERRQLERVHVPAYLDELARYSAAGGGRIEADTVVSPASFEVACLASGAACDATRQVLAGQARTALCLHRPPGHHALRNAAMGFCLLNHVAIAAHAAIADGGLDRVLIVDWDVHHGNGTQDTFWRDPRVAFFSSHRWPFYPGTGAADETGSGPGLGTTRNLPLPFGIPRTEFLRQFSEALTDFADQVRPQLVLLSAGFDAHRDDPVGSLSLETEDFAELTRIVLDVAMAHARGRLVSLLEGGYNPGILAGCVEAHLRELIASE
jgi:acetoin utilization deacetylase AcuC-like enzyme